MSEVRGSIRDFHDPIFNPDIFVAQTFVADIGLRVLPSEHIMVVPLHQANRARDILELSSSMTGNYDPNTDTAVVLQTPPDPTYPKAQTLKLHQTLIHEIAHSGTYAPGEHAFFVEAVAGLAHFEHLQALRRTGRLETPIDFVLRRAGVELWLPGSFRTYENADPRKANSSQSLAAAHGLSYGMRIKGMSTHELLQKSRLGSHMQYDLMKDAIDAVQPGLSTEVMRYPESTAGIIQATATIEEAMRSQGYRLPDHEKVEARFVSFHAKRAQMGNS